jgi:hypothetical protein
MAEQIISPGVFYNENVPTVLEAAAAPIGAAIIGPTVLGPVGIPTTVTTYSEFLTRFGGAIISGGLPYSYLTNISAQNYFKQGGTNLLVTRVASGTFTPAEAIVESGVEGTVLRTTRNALLTAVSGTFNLIGATVGSTFTVSASSGGNVTASVVLAATNSLSSITVTAQAGTFTVGSNITFGTASFSATSGSTSLVFTLRDQDIISASSFTLKTISQGIVMNSGNDQSAAGALDSGSNYNLRFEISQVDSASGTFTLLVRQGDDRTDDKTILETWRAVSLDPTRDDYVAKVIGNQTFTQGLDGTDAYITVDGEYPNKSKYIIVSSVEKPTPYYLDGAGAFKPQFTSSLPQLQNGGFIGGTGNLFAAGEVKWYGDITETNVQGLTAANYTASINLLRNKDQYAFNVISVPGLIYEFTAHKTVLDTLITNTTNRGDSILPIDLVNFNSSTSDVVGQANLLNTNYAAAYWPWLLVRNEDTNANVWCPASTVIPSVYVYNDNTSEAWFAPAGFTRGTMPNVITPEKTLPRSLRDTLYNNKVNPIATFPGTGVVVYGQKTLQTLSTALDRVNVRRLLIALKSFIGTVSQNLVFEPNSLQTRNSFLSVVNPYLETVQQNQGLYAFKVVMDASNNGPDVIDRNELRGAIYLQPVKTAEFIVIDFNLTPTGAEFPA